MTLLDALALILLTIAVTLALYIAMMGLAWVAERIVMWWRRGK